MRRPPDPPAATYGLPFSVSMIGSMLHRGRLPGAIEFGVPGRGSNHIMPLFSSTPDCGSSTRLPKEDISVVVIATQLPLASQTVRCVVQLSAASGSAEPRLASRSAYAAFMTRARVRYQAGDGVAPPYGACA